jgi:hypothetical protein
MGSGGRAPSTVTSALDGGGGQINAPIPFISRPTLPQNPLVTELDESQSRSGRCEVEKNPFPSRNRTPDIHPVTRRYTDSAVTA